MFKNELKHYGILGMHWGKTRSRAITTQSSKNIKTKQSEDHVTVKNLKKKKISEMSNQELKALTTRLQLEKQYKDLTKKDNSQGKKFVSDIVLNAGKQTATTYLSKYMSKGVEEIIKKAVK